jgi:TctA family transporter
VGHPGGALPGISPSIAMALLLPLTYGMDPVTAIVLLASVYVGAEYGGSIPAILIRTPGTNSARQRSSTATRWRGRDAPAKRSASR